MLEARIAWFENISAIYITKKFGGLVVECWKLGLLGLKPTPTGFVPEQDSFIQQSTGAS